MGEDEDEEGEEEKAVMAAQKPSPCAAGVQRHGSELTQRPGEEGRRGLPQTHTENTTPH